jgi:hypothetical protein
METVVDQLDPFGKRRHRHLDKLETIVFVRRPVHLLEPARVVEGDPARGGRRAEPE